MKHTLSSPIEFPILRSSECSLRCRCYRFLFGLIINPSVWVISAVGYNCWLLWIKHCFPLHNDSLNREVYGSKIVEQTNFWLTDSISQKAFFKINYFNHPAFGFVKLINLIKTTFIRHFCYQVHKIDNVYPVIERSIELFKRLWFFLSPFSIFINKGHCWNK